MTSFSSDGTRTMRRMVMHSMQPSTSDEGDKKKKVRRRKRRREMITLVDRNYEMFRTKER